MRVLPIHFLFKHTWNKLNLLNKIMTKDNLQPIFPTDRVCHLWHIVFFVVLSSHLCFVHAYSQNTLAGKSHVLIKALTGLDRESAHPLQLHAVKWSYCTAATIGGTGLWWKCPLYGSNATGGLISQEIHYWPLWGALYNSINTSGGHKMWFLMQDYCHEIYWMILCRVYLNFISFIKLLISWKEYVASLIGLYKNNGAVSCDGNYFPLIVWGNL